MNIPVILSVLLLPLASLASESAYPAEGFLRLEATLNRAALELAGNRVTSASYAWLENEEVKFFVPLNVTPIQSPDLASSIGMARAAMQHSAAVEMLRHVSTGNARQAQAWRVLIDLPRGASAVEGTLALNHLAASTAQRPELARLLVREYLLWQTTRIREMGAEIVRYADRIEKSGVEMDPLLRMRIEEVRGLAMIPESLLAAAGLQEAPIPPPQISTEAGSLHERVTQWKARMESSLPELLGPEDVQRRQRLVMKLLRLVPLEYRAGVRDGEVVIPIEYREAVGFTERARQAVAELLPAWKRVMPEAVRQHQLPLEAALESLAEKIQHKKDFASVTTEAKAAMSVLEEGFGLSLRKAGTGKAVVEETELEVRSLLGDSLRAAQAGNWRDAESLRLEAYTTFDLELEMRILPRDPKLALAVERRFLDGTPTQPGIKVVLDARGNSAALANTYASAIEGVGECAALLRVGVSPATAAFTAFTIVLREGLEAVVILAALLAGFRGVEHIATRRRLGLGAGLAVLASALLFLLARSAVSSLSRYGEKLEAIISILAVGILLMVTNWVFHKYYWAGWNSRLRALSKQAGGASSGPWERFAMLGVGFLTVFREGFETTIFMQSLILEGGIGPTMLGLALGSGAIFIAGLVVFLAGARLPYRKLLILTGVLVVSILATFLGSTVRLFQTVGWLSVHPVQGVEIPSWMGVWLGIYPSWEGVLIPIAGLGFVVGAWLWVKISTARVRKGMDEKLSAALANESSAALLTAGK